MSPCVNLVDFRGGTHMLYSMFTRPGRQYREPVWDLSRYKRQSGLFCNGKRGLFINRRAKPAVSSGKPQTLFITCASRFTPKMRPFLANGIKRQTIVLALKRICKERLYPAAWHMKSSSSNGSAYERSK